MTIKVTFQDFESRADLDTYLTRSAGRYVLVGADAEAPRRYYALDLTDESGVETRVGIVSSHHGIPPSWVFSADGQILAVGHDQSVTVVDITNHRLASARELDGVFFEFIPQADPNNFIVLHELGAAKFDFSGNELWSVPTPDIAESAHVRDGKTLVVRHQGPGKDLAINIRTGRAELHNPSS